MDAAGAAQSSPDLIAIGRAAVREPVVLILFLAGFFDGISGNPIHALVLGVAGIALSADAASGSAMWVGSPHTVPGTSASQRRLARLMFAVGVLVYSTVAGGFDRYSWPATISVVVPAALILMVSWRGPLPGAAAPVRPSIGGSIAWATVFVCLGLWELTMLLMQPTLKTDSWPHPTLSTLMDPVLASHPGRTISLCAWAALGWFLARR